MGAGAHLCRVFQSHLGSILPTPEPAFPSPFGSFNPTLVRFCPAGRLWFILPVFVSIPPWFDFAALSQLSQCCAYQGFNPTLVRFCPGRGVCTIECGNCFNPTLVRFCPGSATSGAGDNGGCFNPTLVRFCRAGCAAGTDHIRAFQSHLGSILPPVLAVWRGRISPFQSHLGSILPAPVRMPPPQMPPFQSHLGSILPQGAAEMLPLAGRFQSHLGSILPPSGETTVHAGDAFQSHLGSILPSYPLAPRKRRSEVSIPPWFDFALLTARGVCRDVNSFNPTLVRFCPHPAGAGARARACFNPTLVRFCRMATPQH